MGSLVSPIVANLYMKYFEREALHTASTPRHWFRFVDDTFVIQQESHKQLFLDHINSIDFYKVYFRRQSREWCYCLP